MHLNSLPRYTSNNLMVIKIISLPKEMLAMQPTAVAFVNLIEKLAVRVGPFGQQNSISFQDTNRRSGDVLQFNARQQRVDVETYEHVNKPISKLLKHIQQEYLVGKTLEQLRDNPFALLAIEPNNTMTGVVDAWFIPSFYIPNGPYISSSKHLDAKKQDVSDGDRVYSFELVGEVFQSSLISDFAKVVLDHHNDILSSDKPVNNSAYTEALKNFFPVGNPVDVLREGYTEELMGATHELTKTR